MKAYLMYKEDDSKARASEMGLTLKADLELGKLLDNMADGDKAIYAACEDAILRPLQSIEAIKYRQDTLADAINNQDAVRRMYLITAQLDNIQTYYMSPTRMAEAFQMSVEILRIYAKLLKDLREVADKRSQDFKSVPFRKLFVMLQKELSDSFFAEVNDLTEELKNLDNLLISAKLGSNLQSVGYTLRRKEKGFWLKWKLTPAITVNVEKDPEGVNDLIMRRDRATSEATSILKQAAKYLEDFMNMLRSELAFYVGCINLMDRMKALGMPVSVPTLLPSTSRERSWKGLYDVSLAFTKEAAVIGNDLTASGIRLYIITGANQGGKSTFLRSMGQAQLMAQCGMPVGAESFTAPIRSAVFTHFKKEEDNYMKSGRLDEELKRISIISDHLEPGALMLFNESLTSTNEREGSEICYQITQALIESNIEIFSVTHLYAFATRYLGNKETMFLLAQRRDDMERTFKILPGEPLQTAYGEDLYNRIFAPEKAAAAS
jgi:DNA mismatch repair ATPase MutS